MDESAKKLDAHQFFLCRKDLLSKRCEQVDVLNSTSNINHVVDWFANISNRLEKFQYKKEIHEKVKKICKSEHVPWQNSVYVFTTLAANLSIFIVAYKFCGISVDFFLVCFSSICGTLKSATRSKWHEDHVKKGLSKTFEHNLNDDWVGSLSRPLYFYILTISVHIWSEIFAVFILSNTILCFIWIRTFLFSYQNKGEIFALWI